MKRNYPYTGPKSQGQGAQQQTYGQPPPPAGPAPPLPSSGGPQQAAYANYGYGSVAPPRHTTASMNSAGATDASQPQWNQQWQQPQQYYPQPQQPNTPGAPAAGSQFAAPRPSAQSGPYRPMAAPNTASPLLNQNAAYSPHHPQQPMPYSYQSQASPSQHHQPPAPPSYGYTPPLPQHQNLAPPNNASAQNWPGTYSSGSQVGPPNKKPRYQAPSAPVPAPTPPYVQPGNPPIPPMGGNMAAGPMGPYSGPNPVNPPSQQPYAWQGPSPAPAPHMNPQPLPGHQGPQGRMPSAGGFQAHLPGRSGPAAQHSKGDKGGKGPGPGNGPTNVAGRGMNRNGPQNRGNIQQASSAQRAALPANPHASVNAARAPNGQTRTWGSNANPGNQNVSAGPGGCFQAGRRASAASSVHSDKNVGGLGKKAGSNAQLLTPPNAPRGPSNARNKAGKVVPISSATGSQALKNGSVAAAQTARGPGNASKNVIASGVETDVRIQDPNSTSAAVAAKEPGASSKRAHTDFRILGLEIKELDWSWFAPQALPKSAVAGDEIKTEKADSTQDLGQIKTEEDEVSIQAEQAADASADVKADASAAPLANGDADDDGANRVEEEDQNAEAEQEHDEKQDDGDEHSEHGDASVDHDADADGDGEEDAEAEAAAAADAEAPADPDADAEEEDITMSHADTDTVASNPQRSVAPTPEPSSEPPKAPKAETHKAKSSKAERAKAMANLRDSTKLRFCFAAMSNAGPEGAPTGPKAQIQEQAPVKAESSVQDETMEQKSSVEAKDDSGNARVENAEAVQTKAEEEAQNEEHPKDALEQDGSAAAEEATHADEAEITDAAEADVQNECSAPGKELPQSTDDETAASAEETKVQQSEETSNEIQQTEDAKAASSAKTKKTRSAAEAVASAKGPPQLSLNRIFLSFAANRKRLAIDAEAIKSVQIHRSEHWVEIRIDASRSNDQIAARKKGEEYLVCRGTLLERRGKGQENYTAMTRSEIASVWESAEADVKADQTADANVAVEDHLELPPFFRLPESELTLVVKLDPSAPLPEPTWLRKNDVASLLANLQRGSSAVAGQSETAISVGTAQHVWAGKIEVVDPDPPPSMSTFLYEWVRESFIGGQKERRRFVDELLSPTKTETTSQEEEGEKDRRIARGFVEIVLRLVRGERVTAGTTGGFARAIESATMTNSTTYPGMVMLGLLEMVLDDSKADAGKVRRQVDGLLMEIPRATLMKAVDLTWKDVVEAERKGGGVAAASGSTSSANASAGKPANQKTRQQHYQHNNRHGHSGHSGSGGGRYNGKRKRG